MYSSSNNAPSKRSPTKYDDKSGRLSEIFDSNKVTAKAIFDKKFEAANSFGTIDVNAEHGKVLSANIPNQDAEGLHAYESDKHTLIQEKMKDGTVRYVGGDHRINLKIPKNQIGKGFAKFFEEGTPAEEKAKPFINSISNQIKSIFGKEKRRTDHLGHTMSRSIGGPGIQELLTPQDSKANNKQNKIDNRILREAEQKCKTQACRLLYTNIAEYPLESSDPTPNRPVAYHISYQFQVKNTEGIWENEGERTDYRLSNHFQRGQYKGATWDMEGNPIRSLFKFLAKLV